MLRCSRKAVLSLPRVLLRQKRTSSIQFRHSTRRLSSNTATVLGSLSLVSGGIFVLATADQGSPYDATELHSNEETPLGETAGLSSQPSILNEPGLIKKTWLTVCNSGAYVWRVVIVDGILEILLTTIRSGELLFRFVPLLLVYPVVWFGTRDPNRGNETAGALWWYRFLRSQMSGAGPTFVKLSQWAASRTDLFNAQLCLELGRLHDSNTAHSSNYTKRAVMQAFGVDSITQVFESFDERPLGVGAVAQVHSARLSKEFVGKHLSDTDKAGQQTNRHVAVKVLHPGVERKIKRDLRIMNWGAHVLGTLPGMKWLSLPEEVAVFGEMMESQVDLHVEARNAEKFSTNFANRRGVLFPHTCLPLQSKDVLVENYCDGVPLRAFLDINGHTPFDRKLGATGLEAFLRMLIYDNLVHADLHPGNILVKLSPPYVGSQLDRFVEDFYDMSPFKRTKHQSEHNLPSSAEAHHHIRGILADYDTGAITEQQKNTQIHEYTNFLYGNGFLPSLIFIDCGLVTSLDDDNRRNFIDLFEAVCTFDGHKAGALMIDRCTTPELVINPDVFVLRIQDIILQVRKVSFQLSKLTFSEVFGPVMSAVRNHHVKLAPDFINIIMAMFILEGIGRRLDPDSDILRVALPMLRQWLKEDARNELTWQRDRVNRGTSFNLLKVWLYIEVREYLDRIRDWGYDDSEFFGPFAPFITADSSLA